MKNKLILLGFLAFAQGTHAQSKSFDEKARAYIKQYGAWAIEEQQRVGIPASITLAQGIYETGAGESKLATQANNHFGIKCKKEWRGATFAHTDDAPNECFRKYTTAKDSYIDHSDYLKNSVRYAELFTFDKADYVAWAKGLKKCGYATNPAYAHKLIKMVEDFDLQMYTFAADGKRQNEIVPVQEATSLTTIAVTSVPSSGAEEQGAENESSDGSIQVNGLRAIYCQKGETLLDKAMKFNIRYARLLEINELADEPLNRSMYVYLEPKKAKGAHPTYVVKEGETIELIAHNEGMNSRQLRIYNLMAQNEQAAAGAVLRLQEQSDMRPETYKMIKGAPVVTSPVQTVRLLNPAATGKQDDFLPTKKSVQQTEEIEIGYGAQRPAEMEVNTPPQKQLAKKTTPSSWQVSQVAVQSSRPPVQQVAPPSAVAPKATVNPVPPTGPNGKPLLESEIAAINDAGDLPLTLEPEAAAVVQDEPLDELAILKAKLDKAVYARSSKSNMKVSSDDSAAVHASKANVLATARPAEARTSVPENAAFHVVKSGETGYSIAQKYGIKVKQLNEMNNLNFEGIKVGQKLRVK